MFHTHCSLPCFIRCSGIPPLILRLEPRVALLRAVCDPAGVAADDDDEEDDALQEEPAPAGVLLFLRVASAGAGGSALVIVLIAVGTDLRLVEVLGSDRDDVEVVFFPIGVSLRSHGFPLERHDWWMSIWQLTGQLPRLGREAHVPNLRQRHVGFVETQHPRVCGLVLQLELQIVFLKVRHSRLGRDCCAAEAACLGDGGRLAEQSVCIIGRRKIYRAAGYLVVLAVMRVVV